MLYLRRLTILLRESISIYDVHIRFFVNILVFFTLRYLFKLYASWSNAKCQQFFLFYFVYEYESILFKIWTNVCVPSKIEFDQRKSGRGRARVFMMIEKNINGCEYFQREFAGSPISPHRRNTNFFTLNILITICFFPHYFRYRHVFFLSLISLLSFSVCMFVNVVDVGYCCYCKR